jgi:hypothetical protein
MPVVLRVIALAGIHIGNFQPAKPGDYLATFDVNAHGGRGEATFTPDIKRAMRFADGGEAMRAWRMRSTVRPLRDDGKPNRPLTAYTVETENV